MLAWFFLNRLSLQDNHPAGSGGRECPVHEEGFNQAEAFHRVLNELIRTKDGKPKYFQPSDFLNL